ncbi:tyrosine-type recombinase/integrase, partial [Pseudomonas aeruginosa]|uniref:tyrosine-type recombinase/integrase n=2 Tax=Pseudomonas TaxID=286 RepID=UPI003D2BD5F4
GRNHANRPMSENTINKALAEAGYKGRQTGHGFRHLFSTEMNNRGFNRDWIERQLAHGDRDEIRDTYNHAHYLEQRRGMMQDWADSIEQSNSTISLITARQ